MGRLSERGEDWVVVSICFLDVAFLFPSVFPCSPVGVVFRSAFPCVFPFFSFALLFSFGLCFLSDCSVVHKGDCSC